MKNKTILIILASLIVLGGLSVGKIALAATENKISTIDLKDNKEKLEVELKAPKIPVGTSLKNLNPKNYIEDVYYMDHSLKANEYTAEFIIPEDVDEEDLFEFAGDDVEEIDIKVTLIEEEDVYTIVTMYYLVNFEYFIASRDGGWTIDTMVTGLSILTDKEGKPYLKANLGNNKKAYGDRVRYTTFVDVYEETNQMPLISLGTEYESNHAKNTRSWNEELDGFELQYGYVLKQSVIGHTGYAIDGRSTYVARPGYMGVEHLVRETHGVDKESGIQGDRGYNDAYYEITANGYRLLQLNQLSMNQKILVFETGDTEETIQKKAKSAVILPDHLKDIDRFTYELVDIDTSTSTEGKRVNGLMKVSEELETGGTFSINYVVNYEVKEGLGAKVNPISLPVGTNVDTIDLNDYVEEVSMGSNKLDPADYTVSLVNDINTMRVGESETTIKIVSKKDGKSVVKKTTTNIIWGHTVGSSASNNASAAIDASISLLDNNGKPYLVANEGTGNLATRESSRQLIHVFRNGTDNRIFTSRYAVPAGKAIDTMNKFNNGGDGSPGLKELDLMYGDVFAYETRDFNVPSKPDNGTKTWETRDEKMIWDAGFYERTYYEMTPNGYRLLQMNQLELNPNLVTVDLGTDKSEMDKQAKNAMIIPKHINNESDYRFEFASVDTKTSGKKKTKVNVYEKLASGGEFKTQYEVEYIVNPQVTETYVSEKGDKLKEPKITNVDLGKEYQGQPEKSLSVSGDAYLYQGWLAGDKNPAKDKPIPGNPPVAKDTTTYQYVYKKANNMINMTIPTELLFETDKEDKQVSSKNYEIKNNSTDVSTEVILEEFVKETSDVKLLTSKDNNPTKETKAARLNVMENNKVVIDSLTEATANQSIKTLKAGEKTEIGLKGTYFGSMEESNYVNYHMNFKFKAGAN